MSITIDDPQIPGLSNLTHERLREMTGAETVALMRLRYREGKRAILHVETGDGQDLRQGTLWFFRGNKARSVAQRNKSARFDAAAQSVYEAFPDDHRMPAIRNFLDRYGSLAPALIGGRPVGRPELLRYRPGLSCTFRCKVAGGGAAYVKLINDDDPTRIALVNRRIGTLLENGPVTIAPALAIERAVSAISYGAARGVPLDAEIVRTASVAPVLQSIDALRRFWRLGFTPTRHLSREALLHRASESAAMVALIAPATRPVMRRVMARLEAGTPRLAARPIHADIKLEHIFLDGGRTTFIDTESVSLGPPDYDLAQLYGRLWQAEFEGLLATGLVQQAAADCRRAAGGSFDWCLDVVALRLAKYYAQRPAPDMGSRILAMLRRLR